MPNRTKDEVFQLVKSLEKSEKRNFKLFVNRHGSSAEDLKVVTLFDALDKMDAYDEEALLRKHPSIKKQQLSNLKAQLFRQILSSLRLIRDINNIDLQLHEQMDYAKILYDKALYLQSLKMLDRIKEHAREYHQLSYVLQALTFEKKIESLHITRSIENRAEQLASETERVNEQWLMLGKLSNLALQLYGWYISMGHARDEKDVLAVKTFFENNLPSGARSAESFYERLYLYQAHCWYHYILQDFLQFYRNCQKWVDLFEQYPVMMGVETVQYIKGVHNLLIAHFVLLNHEKFLPALRAFEDFTQSELATRNTTTTVQSFVYLYISKIDRHFMEGTFTEGLALIPEIEEKLEAYEIHMDRHRVLVFYYKIACLCFGSGDNERAISYLNKIIHWKVDLRTDLQCYARLLHLIAHYELGHWELLEYLIKSVYRFMAKMQNLSVVEEEIFKFLRKVFFLKQTQVKASFVSLRDKLIKYEESPLESRSFMYLDIISWLESKIRQKPVQEIMQEKYRVDYQRKKRYL
jgi:hypothetical protein